MLETVDMRRRFQVVCACAALVAMLLPLAPSLAASRPGTIEANSEEFDKRILSELQRMNPQAAELFTQAAAARERGDDKGAAELYGRVFAMAPTFVHALRRQGYEEVRSGQRAAGLAHLRRAVQLDPSSTNIAALALGLADMAGPHATQAPAPSKEEADEAWRLASEASALDPMEPYAQIALCQMAMQRREFLVMDRCVENLRASVPEDLAGDFFDVVASASQGRITEAEAALEKAHAHGLPDEQYRTIAMALAKARTPATPTAGTPRLLSLGAICLAVWGGLLALLLGTGWLLSHAALRAAGRPPAESTGRASGLDAQLRRIYRVVLWACCALYYLSLPLLVAAVLIVGGGIIYAIVTFGYIPFKLLALVVILTLVTLWSIAKSVFVRGRDEDPGLPLDLDRQPRLRVLLDDVAARIDTRPVETVYMTPGTDVAVMERGGFLRQLAGKRRRCLLLGVGVLEGMRLGPFKAVLAHEYGHFSNEDTAGGGFALAVRRSIITMGQGLARGGAAAWYNPAWLFVNGFYRVFLVISQGASRLQETLADRWAASLYGAAAFEEGLRHVIERSIRFDSHINRTLNEVTKASAALPNLYEYRPAAAGTTEEDLARAVEAALNAEPSPYDSHPSPSHRFAWVRLIPSAGAAATAGDDAPVWDLFSDRKDLERRLTDVVRERVSLLYNVTIPAVMPPGSGTP